VLVRKPQPFVTEGLGPPILIRKARRLPASVDLTGANNGAPPAARRRNELMLDDARFACIRDCPSTR